MRKNRETIHVGGHVPPTGRRAVVVTEGPPDIVALEPEPAAHSPTQPLIAAVPGFDLTDISEAELEQMAREVAAEEAAATFAAAPIPPGTLVHQPGCAIAVTRGGMCDCKPMRTIGGASVTVAVPIPGDAPEVAPVAAAPDHRR